jgi:putative MATE family efflux protein
MTEFWRNLREALRGSEQDFTEGDLGRAILLLAVPMVLEMAMESMFAIVNVFWVSSLGSHAIAAVGLTEALETLVFAAAMGLSMGATATVARRIGEKDAEGARVAAGQMMVIGLATSLLIAIPGAIYAPQLLGFMADNAEVVRMGEGYTRIMLGGTHTILLLFLINAVFRGAGDAAIAMRSLWIANIVNLVLDPCFIFGWGPFPAMGVTGSAVATNIGRSAGIAYQLYRLLSPGSRVTLQWHHLQPRMEQIRHLLGISAPGILQYAIATASWMVMAKLVAGFGAVATAGYTIALRIIIVTILPSWGLGGAAATLMGQNLGAQKPERARDAVYRCGRYNMIFLSVVAFLFIVFAEPLVGLFISDPAVVAAGVQCLRLVSYGYPAYAWGMVLVQAFNGAGDTVTPTRINLFCYWLFQLPLAWGLAHGLGWGQSGIFLAITIAETVIALVGYLSFRQETWREQKV